MKPDKKNAIQQPAAPKPTATKTPGAPDTLRINLAIGTLTLLISIFILYIIGHFVYTSYSPDVKAIVDQVSPLSIWPANTFYPEPVERLQFQLTVVLAPLIILGIFTLVNKKRALLSSSIAAFINWAGVAIFILFLTNLLKQNLLYVQDGTTATMFANNLVSVINPGVMIVVYAAMAYMLLLYIKLPDAPVKKIVSNIVAYGIASLIIIDIVLYNVFHLAAQEWGRFMETNAVYYSVTQVYAGKSLLVNLNAQYGLYAWVLNPIFKIIGLSTYKFTFVMALMNGAAFLFVFLGMKRILKNDLLTLLGFLCLVLWQYWLPRLPFETTAHYYYQYMPLRFFFPALVFFLVAYYNNGTAKTKKIILPIMAISSSVALLWNLDSGLFVFAAALISLLLPALGARSIKEAIQKAKMPAAWMIGSLAFIIFLFFITTKVHSSMWPDISSFSKFQNIFYISGYFMLPMSFFHFWNLPAIVYLISCIYCVYHLRKDDTGDNPILAFLFILGCGLFTYFQGRSYDYAVDVVMYPALIILTIFCRKLANYIKTQGKLKLHESVALFLIPFIFIADGALSMLYYTPSIQSFAESNAFDEHKQQEDALAVRMNFIKNNIPAKDTVLILAKDFDSYYYASGDYYNPLNMAGSTEMFFRSELDSVVSLIKRTNHPILYDASHPWQTQAIAVNVADSIAKALAESTTIVKETPDRTMVLLKHDPHPLPNRLKTDTHTICYKNYGDFNKLIALDPVLNLPANFTIEFFATIDPRMQAKGALLFSNMSPTAKCTGFIMVQNGDDPMQYAFAYGNGATWSPALSVKLSATGENHVVIHVQNNMLSATVNDQPFGPTNTNMQMRNSNSAFYLNSALPGKIDEIKVSDE